MTCNNDLRYEFGPYQLDPSKRILTRDGEGIALTPKANDILLVLVKHAGQLVEKDELLKEVWPDTFVEEANLSQIFLRRALGDDRTGYRFMSSVQTIAAECESVQKQGTGSPTSRQRVARQRCACWKYQRAAAWDCDQCRTGGCRRGLAVYGAKRSILKV